jgi:hypothetical protein
MRARPLLSNADSYRGVHQIVHQLLSLRKVSLFAIRDRKAAKQSPQSLRDALSGPTWALLGQSRCACVDLRTESNAIRTYDQRIMSSENGDDDGE